MLEVAPDEKATRPKALRFEDVRKIVPRLASEFRTDQEAIRSAPELSKRGITESLTKDLREKISQAKGMIDAWLIMKESEVARLSGNAHSGQQHRAFDDEHTQAAEISNLGSLHDSDAEKILPRLENLFQSTQRAIERKFHEGDTKDMDAFVRGQASFLAQELEQAKRILAAWFAMLSDEVGAIPSSKKRARSSGSAITDQEATSVYIKAAELLRGQKPARSTAPLEQHGTAPLVEGEFDIDSGKIVLQNLITTLSTAVIDGPKSGNEFLSNIQKQYEVFEKAADVFFALHTAINARYRGQHLHDATRDLGMSAIDLKHLVGGIKSLMVLSSTLKSEMGTANAKLVEDRMMPIKDKLDQLWVDIDRTIVSVPAVWKGSRRLLPHPKKGT